MELDDILAVAMEQVAAGKGSELLPIPVNLLYCAEAQVTAESFLSYYGDDPLRDTPTALAEARIPALVIAGSEDTVVPGLVDAVSAKAPHVAVEEIDGADHFFRDLYADELVELAVEFIEENP
jgi:pimeloyl-ACP methyl ester carboxylesterase